MEFETILDRFRAAGQEHVFQYWDTLNEDQQKHLLEQAKSIDLGELQELINTHLQGAEEDANFENLEPAPYVALPDRGGNASEWEEAKRIGRSALQDGKVAAFVVAGGQGTRLGYNGPKGTFPVTPIQEKPLFQLFAEKIQGAEMIYETTILWFIMTSQINDAETRKFFEINQYFGLRKDQVTFFTQGLMPAVSPVGKIMLEDRGTIAMSPDGHGGSLRALVRSGAVKAMEEKGIDYLSYFQVDNPLIQAIDPYFIGFHISNRSDMSSKMLAKAYPEEKVGVFCLQEGKTCVVEYSDLPEDLMQATDEKGNLKFSAGSIAIHILSRDFIHKVGSGENPDFRLPFHRAHKKIQTLDGEGNSVQPEEPNGYKFEMFVFDALPFAQNPSTIECRREDEFAPVKNAEGQDSPQTCKEAQLKKAARWFAAAGAPLETDAEGVPTISVEISPLFATNEQAFVNKWQAMEPRPPLVDGLVLE